jgi:putative transposase
MTFYLVILKSNDKETLNNLLKRGKHTSREIIHAQILLLSNEGHSCAEILDRLPTTRGVIYAVRKRYCTEGLDSALHDKARSGQPLKVTPEIIAYITALACSDPPKGEDHWTITLLQQELVTRFGDRLGWGTVKGVLKRFDLKPWKKRNGVSRRSHQSL